MEPALLAARLLLAAVFATAAATKLAAGAESRAALAGFGVPDRLTRPLVVLLPLAELGTAAALVLGPSTRWGAFASLVLLLAFSAAIVINLLRGRAPDCVCFGRLHSTPVSWWTAVRNGLLALVAAGIVWSAPAGLLLAGLAGALGVTVVERRRAGGSGAGLAVGAEAPTFELPAPDGSTVSLASLLDRRRPVLLVFSDAHCGPCRELAPEVARWQRERAGALTVAVVERGLDVEQARRVDEHGRAHVLLDDGDVWTVYGAGGTPSAVLVDADGKVASLLVTGGPAIRRLVDGGREPAPWAGEVRPGLTRLELLTRAGTAAAALGLLGAREAVAGAIPIVVRCKYVRCGSRCCPKTATCSTRRGKKVCVCPDGRETCGSRCCKETFECRKTARGRKVCACPPRTRPCQGRCVPLTDAANCGRCGTACPPATVCVNGECVSGDGTGTGPGGEPPCTCPPGETCCDGACTDLNTDERHCGRCEGSCPPGQECCDGTCKDLLVDSRNCGACGKRCPAGQVCANGRCVRECPPGLEECGGSCVDTQGDDFDNCGRCGRSCSDLTTASDPACCGGECVDLVRPQHCGACFRECRAPCACFADRDGHGRCVGGTFDNCPDNPPLKRAAGRLVQRLRAGSPRPIR